MNPWQFAIFQTFSIIHFQLDGYDRSKENVEAELSVYKDFRHTYYQVYTV